MATKNSKKKSTGPKKKTATGKSGSKSASARKKPTASRKKSAVSTKRNDNAVLKWYKKGDFDKAWAACQSLVDDVEQWQETESDTLLLTAFVALRAGHPSSAHDILDAVAAKEGQRVACEYVSAHIALEFNQPGEALKHAQNGLALFAVDAELNSRWLTRNQAIPQLYFVAGQANYSSSRLANAAAAFERVTDLQPDNQYGYLHLALTFKAQGKIAEARETVILGKKKCPTHNDLDKVEPMLTPRESISLCMIVKNEEEMLGQCLESVREIVDEIIVVDTGSKDKTVEIAESFGARVYHHPWENDFSKHRNQSIDYATGDWILILDADEELLRADFDTLRQATAQTSCDAVSISVHNKHLRTGEITSFLPSIRLWRSKLGAKYEGIVHNELRLPPDCRVLRADVRVIHYGYGLDWEKMKKKIARSKTLLEKQLEENPDNAFANFNYAQLIRGEHKQPPPEACQEILKYAGRAVKNTSPSVRGKRHIHLMALDQMTSAYFYLRDYEKAEETARRALKIAPDYLDSMFALGNIYAGRRDLDKAINAYNRYIDAADKYDPGEETTSYILLHGSSQPRACFNIGLAYEELGRNAEAEENFKRILKYCDTFQDLYSHLALVSLRLGNYSAAEEYSRKRLQENANDNNARQLLARACYRQRKFTDARAICRQLLEISATDTIAMELLIAVERADNDDESALTWIEELLDLEPDNIAGLREKADIFAARDETDKALALYEKLHQLQPRNAEFLNDLANCYFRMDEFKEAVRFYSEALAIRPQLMPSLRNLGLTYFKLGERDKAIEKLANYLDYDQNDSDILYLTARLYFDRGDFADAIRYVERCLQLNPSSAELTALLADCYLKLGHVKSAQMGYQKALAIDPEFSPAAEMLKLIENSETEDEVGEEVEQPIKS